MPQDLSPLTRELQKEICPQRVLDEVGRRISNQRPSPGRLRLSPYLAALGLVLVYCLALWRWQPEESARRQAKVIGNPRPDSAQIASQAEASLALMGNILLSAGVRSQEVILQQAVPPLRDSLQSAKNKIIQHLEP